MWPKFTFRNFSLCRTWLLVKPRIMSGVRQSDHIAPLLEDLHWLPVSQRVVFKTVLMVWKCVHSVAPAYLSDLCILATATSGRQHLRSLLVLRAQTATGQRSFAVNGPSTWNRMPPALWSLDLSESAFKPHWRRTCSWPPVATETSSWFWRRI